MYGRQEEVEQESIDGKKKKKKGEVLKYGLY